MPRFLQINDAFRLIQRELPEGAYADGSPTAYFTTASVMSKAQLIANAYANQERIYANFFPQSADEKIVDWALKVFGDYLPDGLTLAQQQELIVQRLRYHPGINRQAITDIVRSIVGPTQPFFIVDWNQINDGTPGAGTGVWMLDESELDIDTYLGGGNIEAINANIFPTANFCINDPAFGITDAEYFAIREQAYTYEVQFYGFTLSSGQRVSLDAVLSRGEPARSQHLITDGLNPADMPGGMT